MGLHWLYFAGYSYKAWCSGIGKKAKECEEFLLPVLVLIFILIPHLIYVTPSYHSALAVSHIIAPLANQFYRIELFPSLCRNLSTGVIRRPAESNEIQTFSVIG